MPNRSSSAEKKTLLSFLVVEVVRQRQATSEQKKKRKICSCFGYPMMQQRNICFFREKWIFHMFSATSSASSAFIRFYLHFSNSECEKKNEHNANAMWLVEYEARLNLDSRPIWQWIDTDRELCIKDTHNFQTVLVDFVQWTGKWPFNIDWKVTKLPHLMG